jgi:protein-disulfide isomerase
MKLFAIALAALLPCVAASQAAEKGKTVAKAKTQAASKAQPAPSTASVTQEIEKGKIYGNPSAPIRIEIFSDFQCPACKSLHDQLLPTLMKEYILPGKLYVVAREFPLPMHPYSREAANYATAAARFGIYQPVSDRLFQNQATWAANGKVWDTVASVLSPDQQKKVQGFAKDPAVLSAVQRDVELGQRERVQSTPTMMYMRGAKKFALPWPVNYTFLKSLLDGQTK